MILEGAADEPDAVGEQRRGEGVAGKAAIAPAVEAKRERPRAVDQAAGCEDGDEVMRAPRAGGRTPAIAWVRVSRVTTSQARQPAA